MKCRVKIPYEVWLEIEVEVDDYDQAEEAAREHEGLKCYRHEGIKWPEDAALIGPKSSDAVLYTDGWPSGDTQVETV